MAVTLYSTGTRYVGVAFTLGRGTPADITAVGIRFHADPNHVPTVAEFANVTLVQPGDSLADPTIGTKLDIVALVGARLSADVALAAGDWQAFSLIVTAAEDIIDYAGVVTVK